RVGERMEKAGALGRRRPAPRPVDGGAGRLDGAIDVGLAGHRGAANRLARRRLDEGATLARGGPDTLPIDEEAVLVARRDRHEPEITDCSLRAEVPHSGSELGQDVSLRRGTDRYRI